MQKILKGVKVNNNIQFAKIDVRKHSRAKQTALVFLGAFLLAVLSFFSVLSVRAYFTSTANKSGTLTFGTIEVKLLNGTSDFTASSFQTAYLKDVFPGSTLNFNDITVKNTGTHSAYVLLNLDVSIPSSDGNAKKLLHYNKWYNVNGEEVNTTNMAINTTAPTLIASGSSASSNIQWKVPSIVGNDYKTSTVTVNMTVYGSQSNLPDGQAYADYELYASYFICSNASKIANDNGTTYSGATITQDPLRKIVTSKNLFDGKFVKGIIDANTGVFNSQTSANQISTENYIRIKPNTTYTMTNPIVNKLNKLRFYDIEKNYLGYSLASGRWLAGNSNTNLIGTGTTPVNAYYVKFELDFDDAETGQAVIDGTYKYQLEEGSTATTYEPYSAVEDTFDINTQTLTRNVGVVEFNGTERWVETSISGQTETTRYTVVPLHANLKIGSIDRTSLNSHFEYVSYNVDNIGYLGTNENTNYSIKFDILHDVTAFKDWLAEQYANGTPVTVWFQMETPTTEKVLTSKNLYNGPQRLTSISNQTSTVNSAGTITIKKGATPSISGTTIELGGDVFDMFYNNRITISSYIKRYSDDSRTNARLTISYFTLDGKTSINSYQTSFNAIPTDGEWHYQWLTPSVKIAEFASASSVGMIKIWLNDNSSLDYSHFDLKDIQIEVGEAPTDFESYDSTEYKRVNGVALRQVGTVKDTYDASTKKITRNVGELVLTGGASENWTLLQQSGVNQFHMQITNLLHSSTHNIASTHYETILIADRGHSYGTIYTGTTYAQGAVCINDNNYASVELWKAYLAQQYAVGRPVKVWYQLKTPTTETLS